MTNDFIIWSKLIAAGMTKEGAAGMMGNLYAESAFNPINLQQSYERSLGYTDCSYTSAVDSGKYKNFVHDSAGYGLAQWTFSSRKQALLNYAKENGVSIGDLNMQVAFLIKELKQSYPAVWATLCSTGNTRTASNTVLFKYESPTDQSASVQATRYNYSLKYYNMFANATAPTKSVDEIAAEVIRGEWDNGDERKSKLESAGYNYLEVQKAVNGLLSGSRFETVTNNKKTIKVTISIDDHEYSGLLEEN